MDQFDPGGVVVTCTTSRGHSEYLLERAGPAGGRAHSRVRCPPTRGGDVILTVRRREPACLGPSQAPRARATGRLRNQTTRHGASVLQMLHLNIPTSSSAGHTSRPMPAGWRDWGFRKTKTKISLRKIEIPVGGKLFGMSSVGCCACVPRAHTPSPSGAEQQQHKGPRSPRTLAPLDESVLKAEGWIDEAGAIRAPGAVVQRTFEAGVSPALRSRLWLHLLGIVPWDAVARDAERLRSARRAAYKKASALWRRYESRLGDCPHGVVREYHRIIEVDVPRTDRDLDRWKPAEALHPLRRMLLTHCAAEGSVGYYQGHNDLAAVVLFAVGDDEADAYFCFRQLVARLAINFEEEQRGIWRQTAAVLDVLHIVDRSLARAVAAPGANKGQLLFLFQPVFLVLKRELSSYEDVARAWEAWFAVASPEFSPARCRHFHLLLIAAFVIHRRADIMKHRTSTGGLLQVVNGAARSVDSSVLLRTARAVHRTLAPRAAADTGSGSGVGAIFSATGPLAVNDVSKSTM